MFLFIVCVLIVGFLCCLILIELCKCIKIKDTSEADNTETDYVPIKAAIERHNAQLKQQWITEKQKVQQHISSILDRAYKDYVTTRIKENRYIYREFILCKGEYGITYSEILAIDQPFTYSIYTVEVQRSDAFDEYYIKVTVNN